MCLLRHCEAVIIPINHQKEYSSRDFSNDVAAFMDTMNLYSAVFVGFSMGGVVAKRLALDHTRLVDGLIMIGTPVNLNGKPHIEELWELLLTLEAPIDPDFIRAFNEGVPVKPGTARIF